MNDSERLKLKDVTKLSLKGSTTVNKGRRDDHSRQKKNTGKRKQGRSKVLQGVCLTQSRVVLKL